MKHSHIMSSPFSFVTAAAQARFSIPRGATAFRVQGFPNAAAAVPSAYPHYMARITFSVASASPVTLPPGSDFVAQFDFLEHPWLWDDWIPLSEEDSSQGRGLTILNGGNAACAGAIQQGRVLWRVDTEGGE